MKYTVQRGLSVESPRTSVPLRYRSRLPDYLPQEQYTLLMFRSNRRDVVLSKVVESALAKVGDTAGQLVAVAGCFTAEGLELLQARQTLILVLSEFHWTDESFQAIRQHY